MLQVSDKLQPSAAQSQSGTELQPHALIGEGRR